MTAVLSTFTKTTQSPPIAMRDVAATAGTFIEGSAFPVTSKLSGECSLTIGRQSGSAFTAGWPNVLLQKAFVASPTANQWRNIQPYQPAVGASIANTTLSGAVAAGATNFSVASVTNIAAGDLLYLGDASPANYEVVEVAAISGTTITPVHPIVNNHASGAQVTDQAETTSFGPFSLDGVMNLRGVVDNIGGGQAFAVELTLTTLDNVSSQ